MTAFIEEGGWTMTMCRKPDISPRPKSWNPQRGRSEDDHRREALTAKVLALRMCFTTSLPTSPAGQDPLAGVHNFYLGNDPAQWRPAVKAFGKVIYRGLYPGIDLQLRRSRGKLEYDLLLEPGADAAQVELRVEGNTDLRIDPDGSLVIETEMGDLRQASPLTWEVTGDGEKRPLVCTYQRRGPHTFGFRHGPRSQDLGLVIDPVLDYSTFIGTYGNEIPIAVEVDGKGQATVVGNAQGSGYPTTIGAWSRVFYGQEDLVVTRFNATGTALVYSTYLGGSGSDTSAGMAQDTNGNIYITGRTNSANFPTTAGALRSTLSGPSDAFVVRLGTGGNLFHSTYLGGSRTDYGMGIDIIGSGNTVTLTGLTDSINYPVTAGAYGTSLIGGLDIFITRINMGTIPSLVWSTYFGTRYNDDVRGVAVDPQGNAYITGQTTNQANTPPTTFPTTSGAFDTTYNGSGDAYLTCINSSGAGLVYSTFLGGTYTDSGMAIAVDPTGRAFVTGITASWDLPTTPGVVAPTLSPHTGILPVDVFVSCIDPTGSTLAWSSFLGGDDWDEVTGISVDRNGNPVVIGRTKSATFPTTPGALNRNMTPVVNSFITCFGNNGTRLRYSTRLGFNGEHGRGVTMDNAGNKIYACIETTATNFPTTSGVYDPSHNGGSDIALTAITLDEPGFTVFGNSTRACTGPLAAYCMAPLNAGGKCGLACMNTPPSTQGVLVITHNRLPQAQSILGFDLWLDLTSPLIGVPVTSYSNGECMLIMPIPAGAKGAHFYCQFIWRNTVTCGGRGTYSASDPMEITIQ